MTSRIIIANDFEAVKKDLINEVEAKSLFFYQSDDLLIDEARLIIDEAYIAEVSQKILVIMANSFTIPAQNALLKVLEEPPRNICFLLVAPAKHLLLPTIRSRLPIVMHESVKKNLVYEIDLDIKTLTLQKIIEFVGDKEAKERTSELSKIELKAIISAILKAAINAKIDFSVSEYEYFYKLFRLAELNSKSSCVLTPLLLLILSKVGR